MNAVLMFSDHELGEWAPLGQATRTIAQGGIADVNIGHPFIVFTTPVLYPIYRGWQGFLERIASAFLTSHGL